MAVLCQMLLRLILSPKWGAGKGHQAAPGAAGRALGEKSRRRKYVLRGLCWCSCTAWHAAVQRHRYGRTLEVTELRSAVRVLAEQTSGLAATRAVLPAVL